VSEIAAVQERVTAAGEQKMLGVAGEKVNARKNWVMVQFGSEVAEMNSSDSASFSSKIRDAGIGENR